MQRRSNAVVDVRTRNSSNPNSDLDETHVIQTPTTQEVNAQSTNFGDIATSCSTTSPSQTLRGWHHQVGQASAVSLQLQFLQLLVPDVDRIQALVSYAEKRVLWYHGCCHGPTFNAELQRRLSAPSARTRDTLTLQANDLHWTALLFAVISCALTCASPQAAQLIGFEESEAQTLSRQWYRASTTCLEMAEYRSNRSIYAVQALATLTMCAHTLGKSSEQYILIGSAIHLAWSFKLHRLSLGDEEVNPSSPPEVRRLMLENEVGRRLFCQLCVQDWFSIPLANAHSIHRGDFTTVKPRDRDYITM